MGQIPCDRAPETIAPIACYQSAGQLAVGFKAQINFGRPQIYDWDGLAKILIETRVKSIFLYRENVFEQVLSAMIASALKTNYGSAHSIIGNSMVLQENSIDTINLVINIEKALAKARSIIMQRTFALAHIPNIYGDTVEDNFLTVAYETLASRPKEALEKIFQFLDVDPEEAQNATSQFRKITTTGYENNIINYAELVHAMKENGFLSS
jgi:hypothetical protein